MRSFRPHLLAPALSAFALTGCGNGEGGTPTAATAATAAAEETAAPIAEWGWETRASDDFPREDGFAYLVGVRAARHGDAAAHPAFDRVVLELDGDAPSWRVAFEEPPIVEDPTGLTIDVEGEAFLRVSLHPASGLDASGDEPVARYDGPDRIPVDGHVVTEVVLVTDHDGALAWVVGLARQAPFAVSLLADPPRLVVDVVDDG